MQANNSSDEHTYSFMYTCMQCKLKYTPLLKNILGIRIAQRHASRAYELYMQKSVMCQDCLTAALPIVSPSLCLLSRFLANNGNGRLSLDRYFMHQESVVQHL